MKVLPYESFTILTPDSLLIVLQRLNAKVEPTKTFRFSQKHAPYQGSISKSGFKISRIIHDRNSLVLTIRGRFEVEPHQTVIHVQMNTHSFVMAFLGLCLFHWYSTVVSRILAGAMPYHMAALSLSYPMLIGVIFCIAFRSEANRSRTELTKIIQGQI
ncbi:hypothetical protein [uncultured Nostoc sp.]|uniref:hypothetical protein n=1 Tax=uncultured Nostoc sp. TaxID=340711 RepID=UPI0035CB8854